MQLDELKGMSLYTPLKRTQMHTLRELHFTVHIYMTRLAYDRLQQRKEHEWRESNVQLLFGDMRNLDVPEPVDILISELLGSFGDNELSPECLDGVQKCLKRTSYTSLHDHVPRY